VGAIAGGAVGGAVVILLIGLCWWKTQRRNGTGEKQTATASPKVLESARPKEKARASVSSNVAPMQHADTGVGEEKLQPSVKLYGHKIATPTSPVPHPQEVESSRQELAYDQKAPTRRIVTTNPTPDQIRQEVQPQVDEQGWTRTTFTPDSKMVMSWEPPARAQGSTSGSAASASHERELEQRLRALETRITSIDDAPPSYDDKS